jgi:hypothetical protein
VEVCAPTFLCAANAGDASQAPAISGHLGRAGSFVVWKEGRRAHVGLC